MGRRKADPNPELEEEYGPVNQRYTTSRIIQIDKVNFVWLMRMKGASYKEIVQAVRRKYEPFGMYESYNISQCKADLGRMIKKLDERSELGLEEIRSEELGKLEIIESALMEKVLAGDVRSVNAWLKVMERRAQLTGIDKPRKVEVHNEHVMTLVRQKALAEGADPDIAEAKAWEILESGERKRL